MSNFLKLTKERTEHKRQEVATELLAWEKVTAAIGLAAAAGAARVTLTPAAPIKIKHTAAAMEITARLTKVGFRQTWTEHRSALGGPAGDQLEIEW